MINKDQGVTLIELAVVLFIVSLVLGGVLLPLSTRLEQEERRQTTEMLQDIKETLVGFTLVNGYLPCPDCPDNTTGSCGLVQTGLGASAINDGIEDGLDNVPAPTNTRPNFMSCATVEGNLPWVTLGLPEFDAWENRFVYRVDDDFADNDASLTCTTTASFCLDDVGNINVQDENSNPVAQNIPFIVLSLGNEDSNAGTSQNENQDGDITFVYRDYSNETDAFDDLMTWVSTPTLMYQMVRAELLP